MAKKTKFYVVWEGYNKGVFERWEDCKREIEGYAGAKYKSFESLLEAHTAFREGFAAHIKPAAAFVIKDKNAPQTARKDVGNFEKNALSVDAACSGNPGAMEYRGVYVATNEVLFSMGPFAGGTNNIGEFLALVHGLALCKKQNSPVPIYTDSVTALSWVRQKKCKTTLEENAKNKPIFDLIARAEAWLANNTYDTKLLKWETETWGEIPADFGRK